METSYKNRSAASVLNGCSRPSLMGMRCNRHCAAREDKIRCVRDISGADSITRDDGNPLSRDTMMVDMATGHEWFAAPTPLLIGHH